jgi:hypothetical protein
MQNINETTEDISNMAKGHKANISNPSMSMCHRSPSRDSRRVDKSRRANLTFESDTSEESKQNSRQFLESVGGEDAFYGKQEPEKDPNRVQGGLKS